MDVSTQGAIWKYKFVIRATESIGNGEWWVWNSFKHSGNKLFREVGECFSSKFFACNSMYMFGFKFSCGKNMIAFKVTSWSFYRFHYIKKGFRKKFVNSPSFGIHISFGKFSNASNVIFLSITFIKYRRP